MYECFHCGQRTVGWCADFSFEDYGLEGEGIIHVCKCQNCGADIEYYIRLDDNDSNADRIRAMSDEELAEWINKHDCHTNLYGYDPRDAILDWLKSPAGGDGNATEGR